MKLGLKMGYNQLFLLACVLVFIHISAGKHVRLASNTTTQDVHVKPEHLNSAEENISANVPGDESNTDPPIDQLYANQTASNRGARLLLNGATASNVAGTDFPYMALLQITAPGFAADGKLCSSAFISTEYVITIASCVADSTGIKVLYDVAISDTVVGTTSVAGTAYYHPKYQESPNTYNIALVKLATAATASTTVGTVPIAFKANSDESKDLVAKSVRIIGYGHTAANIPLANYKQYYVSMTVMSKSECIKDIVAYSGTTRPRAYEECLGTSQGTIGACNQADLGAPVLYKFTTDSTYTLVGLLDYYRACSSPVPNMFIRIGPFWDWIRTYVSTRTNVG